jgi:hypothetical protein
VAVFSGNHLCGLISNSLGVRDYIEYDPEVVPAYVGILDPWR